eukprot:1264465-Prymnesium_polylepis.1
MPTFTNSRKISKTQPAIVHAIAPCPAYRMKKRKHMSAIAEAARTAIGDFAMGAGRRWREMWQQRAPPALQECEVSVRASVRGNVSCVILE